MIPQKGTTLTLLYLPIPSGARVTHTRSLAIKPHFRANADIRYLLLHFKNPDKVRRASLLVCVHVPFVGEMFFLTRTWDFPSHTRRELFASESTSFIHKSIVVLSTSHLRRGAHLHVARASRLTRYCHCGDPHRSPCMPGVILETR
jgi:hypothetical protein